MRSTKGFTNSTRETAPTRDLSTMREDYRLYVCNCQECQAHGPIDHSPTRKLQHVAKPWPFSTIPNSVVTDNDTQFINKSLHNFYEHLKITHKVTSIEHPQVNGQAKAANKANSSDASIEPRDCGLNTCLASYRPIIGPNILAKNS
ncbi:hypothetical protein CR513_19436, partial [Mucuna pruriens]